MIYVNSKVMLKMMLILSLRVQLKANVLHVCPDKVEAFSARTPGVTLD